MTPELSSVEAAMARRDGAWGQGPTVGDAEIVTAVLAGDQEAFRLLVERYQRPLLASARHLLGNSELAQDAAQETFIEAYRALGNLKDPHKFRAWLYGILRHRCLKVRDAAGPSTLAFEEIGEAALGSAAGPGEEGRGVVELLRQLPREDRELLAARYLQGLSYAEIAEALGITSGAARVRCLRSRERLREIMLREQAMEEEIERCERTPVAGRTG